MRPFKERLVQLILERGPLQLSGAARLLGRDRGFKQAMSEQRLRFPTILELLMIWRPMDRANRRS